MNGLAAPISAGALIATGVAMCLISQVVYGAISGSEQQRILGITPPAALARELPARLAASLSPLLLPVLLFLGSLVLGGEAVTTTRVHVNAGPARDAGVLDGDRIVSVDGQPVATWEAARVALKARHARDIGSHAASRAVDIGVQRGDEARHFSIVPSEDGFLRVAPITEQRAVGFVEALKFSLYQPIVIWSDFIRGASDGTAKSQGPLAIVKETDASAERSTPALGYFIASLGAYLAPAFLVTNLVDWLTLALFLKLNPAAGHADAKAALAWRVARCRQLLHLTLVVSAVAGLAHEFLPVTSCITVPVLVWFSAMAIPLLWLVARAIFPLSGAILVELALVAPIVNLFMFWYVSRTAREFMSVRGLRPVGVRILPRDHGSAGSESTD